MTKAGLQFSGPYPRDRSLVDRMIGAGVNVKGIVSPALKSGEGMGLMLDIASRSPDHVHIARVFDFDEDVSRACKNGDDPVTTAQTWLFRVALLASIHPAMLNLWWETGPNEPGMEYLGWVNRYAAAIIQQSARHRLRIVWGNFSVGTPDYSDWPILGDALTATRQANVTVPHRVLLGLHEYGVVHQGKAYSMGSADSSAFLLRFHDQRVVRYVGDVPKVITELGDDPEVRGDRPEYVRRFGLYDEAVKCDPYVVAWFGFVLPNEQGEWGHFALDDGTADDLIAIAQAGGGSWKPLSGKPAGPPRPPPVSTLPPGQARVIATGIKLRRGPGDDYAILSHRLKRGEIVGLLDEEGEKNIAGDEHRHNWVYVRAADGTEGWVAAWLLKPV